MFYSLTALLDYVTKFILYFVAVLIAFALRFLISFFLSFIDFESIRLGGHHDFDRIKKNFCGSEQSFSLTFIRKDINLIAINLPLNKDP